MPCFDGREGQSNNLATRFCCETLGEMERHGIPIPDYMKQWWEDHQKWDAEHGRPHNKGHHKEKV